MGILPLQYMPGEDRARLGLSGDDPVDLEYLGQGGVLPLVLREVLAKT